MLDDMLLQPGQLAKYMPIVINGIGSVEKPLSFISRMIRKNQIEFASKNRIIIPYISSGSTLDPANFNAFADTYLNYLTRSEEYEDFGSYRGVMAFLDLACVCVYSDSYGLEHRIDWDANPLEAFRNTSNYGPAMKLFSNYVKQEGRLLIEMLTTSNTIN